MSVWRGIYNSAPLAGWMWYLHCDGLSLSLLSLAAPLEAGSALAPAPAPVAQKRLLLLQSLSAGSGSGGSGAGDWGGAEFRSGSGRARTRDLGTSDHVSAHRATVCRVGGHTVRCECTVSNYSDPSPVSCEGRARWIIKYLMDLQINHYLMCLLDICSPRIVCTLTKLWR